MRADTVCRRRILVVTFLREGGGRSDENRKLQQEGRQIEERDGGRRARERAW